MIKTNWLKLPSKLKTVLVSHPVLPSQLKTLLVPDPVTYKDLIQSGPHSVPVKRGNLSIKELFRKTPPQLTRVKTGLFGVPLLNSSKGIEKYWDLSYEHCEDLLSQIITERASVETVKKFDDLSNAICLIADTLTFIADNHQDGKIVQSAKRVNQKALNYVETLNTNIQLFNVINSIINDKDVFDCLDTESQYVVRSFIFDFEQSGIHLPEESRSEFVEITERIARVGPEFLTSSYLPVHVPAAKCTHEKTYQLPMKGRFVVVENSGPNHPFTSIREFMWTNYHRTDERRENLLKEILKSRQHLARHVGFDNFAQRELRGSMAGSVTNVLDFLTELKHQLTPFVESELKHLQFAKASLNRSDPTEQIIHPWDTEYITDNCKKTFLEKNCYSNGMFSDMLNIGNLMEGIILFIERVYGIHLVHQMTGKGELWCNDVVKLAVYDHKRDILGYIYCDFFRRDGKKEKMCLHTIHCGTKTQYPVVVLQGDLEYNSTMRYNQLEALFHEFGHALHAMLGTTTYQHVSGTRCPTDMAEIPSILMENLLGHPRVFTNVTMPHMIYDKPAPDVENYPLQSCYSALATETHLFYSMLDLQLHTEQDIENTTDVLMSVQEEYSHIPYCVGSSWQHRFSHLYTYGARYYSYLWSKSISNIIYQDLFLHDPMSRDGGERVKEFLRQGNVRDPTELVEELIGSKLSIESMVESLIRPIRHFNDGYLVHQDLTKNW